MRHSGKQAALMHILIKPILAFNDNYIWAMINEENGHCAVVDPGDARPVLAFLSEHALTLEAILITHHHADHVGGVKTLIDTFDVPVYAPKKEPFPRSIAVSEGDTVCLDQLGVSFSVLDLPGHTRGHVAYYTPAFVFCGDTLFSGGCGRLFEGTPEQFYDSLQKLAQLPDSTKLYCAHEYTVSNLKFAHAVEPDNEALIAYQHHCAERRAHNKPTLPSTMALEKQINPFLRCDQPTVIAAAKQHGATDSPVSVFHTLRQWKDHF
jgi:hydroxyacylglutathione hydrolase